jgi:hypothetical protein
VDNFIAVAVLYKTGDLVYCKNGDQSWTFIDMGLSCCDVIYYKEQFYAVNEEGAIAMCDLNGASPSVSVVKPPKHDFFCILYLVDSGDDELLLVARYLCPEFEYLDLDDYERPSLYFKTEEFDVFRMNWSGPEWERVVNLGDRVLFVGKNSSASLSVSDVRGYLQNEYLDPNSIFGEEHLENCIYFTDDYREVDYDGAFGSDSGIYRVWIQNVFGRITSLPCYPGTPYSLWVAPNPT